MDLAIYILAADVPDSGGWGLRELLATTAVSGIVSGVLVYWAQAIIRREQDQKLETHKANVKGQHDTELEHVRAELRVLASEKEIRFAKMHEKRAEAIATIYGDVLLVMETISDYVSLLGDTSSEARKPKRQRGEEALGQFWTNYYRHSIYLPDEIDKQVRGLIKTLWGVGDDFGFFIEGQVEKGDRDRLEHWREIYEKLQNEVPPVLKVLKKGLRRLLGVECEDSNA